MMGLPRDILAGFDMDMRQALEVAAAEVAARPAARTRQSEVRMVEKMYPADDVGGSV